MDERRDTAVMLPGTPCDLPKSNKSNNASPVSPTNFTSSSTNKEIILFHNKNQLKQSELHFRDGIRQIDMIIAFADTENEKHQMYRHNFETALTDDGFELELEDKANSSEGDIYFLKVHAPWNVLCKYAEAMHLKMPLKVNQEETQSPEENNWQTKWTAPFKSCFGKIKCCFHSRKVDSIFAVPTRTAFLTAPFVLSRAANFAIDSTDTFFLPSQRSMLVWHTLSRTPFSKQKQKVGITKLVQMGVYNAAFPLHDADIGTLEQCSTRETLYRIWGSFGSWYRPQPLGLIRDYFGDKVGMYFAWLGFYSTALLFPAIVGVLCFLYGAMTIESQDNVVSREICRRSAAGNLIMCPLCSNACPYWLLGDSCIYSKVSYLFDNYATGIFAVFMSLWATIYLQMWNRRQATLAWEWDLMETEFGEDEEIRLEYQFAANKNYRISPVTKRPEPYLAPWKRVGRYALSRTGVIFLCFILLIAMVILIVYRIASVTVFANLEKVVLRQNAKLLSSITASLINLVVITIFKWIGKKFIYFLTVFEVPRTQSEFEDSYILKVFIFDFVNVYSSFIYIAIFKGRFYLHPGDRASQTTALATVRVDVCDPSGCFMELCIQLIVVLIGRQLFRHFLDIIVPILQNWWRRCRVCSHRLEHHKNGPNRLNRWEKDYFLEPIDALSIYQEYLEVVLQYGLVTIFVSAFPLAPLFAIINNLIELRIDSHKMISQYRRPVARRVANTKTIIDEIMQFVTFFAVVSNV